jgi:GntR family transcriptional repressor for pyruvate dehydrogenase complex
VDTAARTAVYDVLWDRIIDGAQNLAYRLALNTLVAGQRVLALDARVVGDEIADTAAVRALVGAIVDADGAAAHARARDLLDRSIPKV